MNNRPRLKFDFAAAATIVCAGWFALVSMPDHGTDPNHLLSPASALPFVYDLLPSREPGCCFIAYLAAEVETAAGLSPARSCPHTLAPLLPSCARNDAEHTAS